MEQNTEKDFYRISRGRRRKLEYDSAIYSPEFPISYTPVRAGEYHVYLFGPIESSEQFIGALEVFQAATENDVVHVHLSTPGGSMDATDTFLAGMHMCDGRVIIHATGGVHSCGSIILLNASEFTLSENFNSLVHNGSTGISGDLNKFVTASKHSVEHMNRVLRNTYEGFLTPEELEAMIEGKDFWMFGEEFMARWEKRQEYFKEKMIDKHILQANEQNEVEEIEVTPRPQRKRKKAKQ